MLLLLLLSLWLVVASAQRQRPVTTFSSGISQGTLTHTETVLFNYTLSPTGAHGTITHWWIGGQNEFNSAIFSYYVDGETTASIVFTPAMFAGVGFDGQFTGPGGPKSNSLFGKLANTGGWFSNVRVPFLKSIRLTARLGNTTTSSSELWVIVRGSENLRTTIAGFELPENAKLIQQSIDHVTYKSLDFVELLRVASGPGLILFSVLSVISGNLNFMEGCYHLFVEPATQPYPAIIIATGMEDYFVSSYYFDAGEYYFETSGLTHLKTNKTTAEFSAYRKHDQDPIFFHNGTLFLWRNGDVSDQKTGLKCITETGNAVGSPTASIVTSQVWAYVWPDTTSSPSESGGLNMYDLAA